jgi:anti-sigma factor RsiW
MSPRVEDMLCDEVLDRIEALLDDELGADETNAVQRHLRRCDSCAGELELARQAVIALRELPKLDPPARVIELSKARAESFAETDPPVRPNFHRTAWIGAAAAAVLLAVIGTLTVDRHPTPTTDPEALQAAAELELALACFGDVTRRANRMVKARVIDHGAVPSSMEVLARSLGPLKTLESTGYRLVDPPENTLEGSS